MLYRTAAWGRVAQPVLTPGQMPGPSPSPSTAFVAPSVQTANPQEKGSPAVGAVLRDRDIVIAKFPEQGLCQQSEQGRILVQERGGSLPHTAVYVAGVRQAEVAWLHPPHMNPGR